MDVSIVVATFNCEQYLNRCIDSCLKQSQTNLNYEVIVVDDGSTDSTPQILDSITDKRLRRFFIPNSGIEIASNLGFINSKAEFVVRVDADDLLLPSYLSNMQPYIRLGCPFIYSDYNVINSEGCFVEEMCLPDFDVDEIYSRGDFLATGTLYRRDIVKKLSGYDTTTKNSGIENYEFILRLISNGYVGKHVKKKLFSYRRHGANISDIRRNEIINNGKSLFDRIALGPYKTNKYHPYKLSVED